MQVIAFCCLVLNSQDQTGQLLLAEREMRGEKELEAEGRAL